MSIKNITEIKEVQGLTEKECYTIGSHFVRFYGKTECFLSARLDDIDVKKIFTSEYNYNSFNKDYFIDNVHVAVTYCHTETYNRKRGIFLGYKHYYAVEIFYTEHNRYFREENGIKKFVPHKSKKMLLEPKTFPNKYSGIVKINEMLKEFFGIENLMYDNKYTNKILFSKIVELCEDNEKYNSVHKNFLPYNVYLSDITITKILNKLEKAQFITITNGWIRATE